MSQKIERKVVQLLQKSKKKLSQAAEEKASELAAELLQAGRKTAAKKISALIRWGDKKTK